MAAVRGPAVSDNNMARLVHVATNPRHFDTIQAANQPLSHAELDHPRSGLWDGVLGPVFNNPDNKSGRATPVDGVLEVDLRGMDPTRITCRREATKLQTSYQAWRYDHTKAYSNYPAAARCRGPFSRNTPTAIVDCCFHTDCSSTARRWISCFGPCRKLPRLGWACPVALRLAAGQGTRARPVAP